MIILTEATPDELDRRRRANRETFISVCEAAGGHCPDSHTLDRWFSNNRPETNGHRRLMALREPTTLTRIQAKGDRNGG